MQFSFPILLHNVNDTLKFAQQIAKALKKGDVIALSGDLGSGKTLICREIIRYLCHKQIDVPSPTFNILNTYTISQIKQYNEGGAKCTDNTRALTEEVMFKNETWYYSLKDPYSLKDCEIYHYDLYRIKTLQEIDELGFDEALRNITLIEWPELIIDIIPKTQLLKMKIEIIDINSRLVSHYE